MPNAGIVASWVVPPVTGPCNEVLMEPFDNFSTWTISGTTSIVSGHTGTAAKIGNFSGAATYIIPSVNESDTIIVGFHAKIGGLGSEAIMMTFRSDSSATIHGELRWNSAGSLVYVRGSSGLGTSVAGIVTTNAWCYIEVRIKMHDTEGELTVRANGITVIGPLTNIDTKNGGTKTTFDSIRLECTWYDVIYDNLYITTGVGCPFKGWQTFGDCNSVLEEPFDNFNNWTNNGATIVSGRTGTAAQIFSSNSITYSIPTVKQDKWLTIGFAWKPLTTNTAQRYIVRLQSDNGATDHIALMYPGSGQNQIALIRGLAVNIGTSASGVITPDAWHWIEMKVLLQAASATGSVVVKVNGTTVISNTALQTGNSSGTKTVFDTVKLTPSQLTCQYDDLYITTGPACLFQGDPQSCLVFLQDPFDSLLAWTEMVGSPAIVTGRNGTGVEFQGETTDAIFYSIPAENQVNTLTIGFAWKVSDISERVICQFQSELVVHLELATNAAGGFDIRRGTPTGTILVSSSSGIYSPNTWYYIEFQAKLHNSAGYASVRVNNNVVASLSGLDTRNGPTKPDFDRIGIGTTHTRVQTIDDLYISAGSVCAFQGDHEINLDVLLESFTNFSNWAVSSTPALVTGRTGNAAEINSVIDSLKYTIPVAKRSSTIVVGAAVKLSTNSLTQTLFRFYASGSQTGGVTVNTNDSIFASNAAGTSFTGSTSASGIFTRNVWHYLEVKYVLADGPDGKVIVKVDGTEVINVGNFDSRSIGSVYDQIGLETPNGSSGGTVQYDDLYISTGPAAMFKGDITIP